MRIRMAYVKQAIWRLKQLISAHYDQSWRAIIRNLQFILEKCNLQICWKTLKFFEKKQRRVGEGKCPTGPEVTNISLT